MERRGITYAKGTRARDEPPIGSSKRPLTSPNVMRKGERNSGGPHYAKVEARSKRPSHLSDDGVLVNHAGTAMPKTVLRRRPAGRDGFA